MKVTGVYSSATGTARRLGGGGFEQLLLRLRVMAGTFGSGHGDATRAIPSAPESEPDKSTRTISGWTSGRGSQPVASVKGRTLQHSIITASLRSTQVQAWRSGRDKATDTCLQERRVGARPNPERRVTEGMAQGRCWLSSDTPVDTPQRREHHSPHHHHYTVLPGTPTQRCWACRWAWLWLHSPCPGTCFRLRDSGRGLPGATFRVYGCAPSVRKSRYRIAWIRGHWICDATPTDICGTATVFMV